MSRDEIADRYKGKGAILAMKFLHAMENTPIHELLAKAEKIQKLDAVARKMLGLEEEKPANIINIGLLSSGPPPLMPPPQVITLDAEVILDTVENPVEQGESVSICQGPGGSAL